MSTNTRGSVEEYIFSSHQIKIWQRKSEYSQISYETFTIVRLATERSLRLYENVHFPSIKIMVINLSREPYSFISPIQRPNTFEDTFFMR